MLKYFEIENFGFWRDTNVPHTLETLCYLGGAKLVSATFKRGLLTSKTKVVVQVPTEESWNTLHDALFHQWYGFQAVDPPDYKAEIIPMPPRQSGANDCLGNRFVEKVYLTQTVSE